MKHGISFIHISEKNLTFEGISDAIEYDFICLCIFIRIALLFTEPTLYVK